LPRGDSGVSEVGTPTGNKVADKVKKKAELGYEDSDHDFSLNAKLKKHNALLNPRSDLQKPAGGLGGEGYLIVWGTK